MTILERLGALEGACDRIGESQCLRRGPDHIGDSCPVPTSTFRATVCYGLDIRGESW